MGTYPSHAVTSEDQIHLELAGCGRADACTVQGMSLVVRRQVLTSRNVRGGHVINMALGAG
jgi:hypothetical protein